MNYIYNFPYKFKSQRIIATSTASTRSCHLLSRGISQKTHHSHSKSGIHPKVYRYIRPSEASRVTLIRAKRHGPEAEATPAIHSGLDIRGFNLRLRISKVVDTMTAPLSLSLIFVSGNGARNPREAPLVLMSVS